MHNSLPQKHKAMVYDRPGTLSLKCTLVDTPRPSHGQVLVRLTHSGVCHTDYSLMTTAWSWLPKSCDPGQVGGHEGVGAIVAIGPGVEETSSLRIGLRVGLKYVYNICHSCPACFAGLDGSCFKLQITGFDKPGCFQQYTLAPASYVTPIPDAVPSELAAPLMCGGLTAWAALKKARTQPGEWIVISGAGGGIGHLACQMASKAMGLRVLGIDSQSKEELARDCGAEQYLCSEDFSQNNLGELAIIDAVKTCTVGLGAAAVLVCNGSDSSYAQSLGFLRVNGTMVVVGCQEGPARPIATATPNMILFNQLHITGIAVGNRNDAIEVLDLAARGVIRPRVNVEHAEDLEAIFTKMHTKQSSGKTVVEIF